MKISLILQLSALLVVTTTIVFADVRCRTGEFAHSCPSAEPVCCFDSEGYSTGCCRSFTSCSSGGDCDPGSPLPPNTTATELQDIESVVHFSWQALVITIACAIGTLLVIGFATFASGQFRSYMARRRVELRARQLREAGLLGDGSENEDGVEDDPGYEPDQEVTSDDEREYREHVLSSEQATLRHAVECANNRRGVIGRVSAWFSRNGAGSNLGAGSAAPTAGGAESPRNKETASNSNVSNNNNNNNNVNAGGHHTDSHMELNSDIGGDQEPAQQQNASERTALLGRTRSEPESETASQQQQNVQLLPAADPTEKFLLINCSLCKVRLANCSLIPCLHSDICEDCAKNMKRCPDCKTVIKKRIKIFLS